VYVYMVEENELGVCWVWHPILCVHEVKTKVEGKD